MICKSAKFSPSLFYIEIKEKKKFIIYLKQKKDYCLNISLYTRIIPWGFYVKKDSIGSLKLFYQGELLLE